MKAPGIAIEDHGSIFLFRPASDGAFDWLRANVQSDAQWLGYSLAVEHRYARDLASALVEAGFEVK
jgi:hypothetical protein